MTKQEQKEKEKRLKRYYLKEQREKDREHRRANRSCVSSSLNKSKAQPVGTKRKAMSAEEKKAKLLATLDDNKLGDSFIKAQIDGLFLGCSSCKSSVRHIINRWDIEEDPETLMPKIDRVSTTVYKKQPADRQMFMTVKDVAVILIKHIEAFRQRNPIILESADGNTESIAHRRAETVDASSVGPIELTSTQRP